MNNSTENLSRDQRPWGYYDILSEHRDYRIKRVVVFPGQRMSLQRHRRRSEHWFVINGIGHVTVGEEERGISKGDSIDIPAGSAHRVGNSGKEDLVIIEIQTGQYFGEDDIERIADDYGRQG
jgi:mannose-6-phosphate isomerase